MVIGVIVLFLSRKAFTYSNPKILLGEDKNSETEEYSKFISLPLQK